MRLAFSNRLACAALAMASFGGSFLLGRWLFAFQPVAPAEISPIGGMTARGAGEPEADAGAPGDVWRSLTAVLEGDDPFVCAERMVAWLEKADAETFRAMGADPGKFPVPTFTGFEKEFRDAYFHALAARWLAVDPEGALPAMLGIQKELAGQRIRPGPLDFAARIRPELVLEKLPFEMEGFGLLNRFTSEAVSALATHDPKAARRFAEGLKAPRLRKNAFEAMAAGLAERDPMAALAIAQETENRDIYPIALRAAERIGSESVRQVLQAAGTRLSADAISPDFVMRHPDLAADMPDVSKPEAFGLPIRASALAQADRVSPEKRRELLAGFDSLPATAGGSLAAALASSWARTEPLQAAQWALAHSQPDDVVHPANQAAQMVFLRWINNDAEAALAWWRTLPASPLRDAIGTNASTYLAEDGQLAAALEIFHPRGLRSEQDVVAQFGRMLAQRDPQAAGKWFAALPPEAASEWGATAVVEEMFKQEPEAAARWIEALPAGAIRDNAALVFAKTAASEDAEAGAAWVGTITDLKLKTDAAGTVFSHLRSQVPAVSRKWLSELRGVDPDWQARMLRAFP